MTNQPMRPGFQSAPNTDLTFRQLSWRDPDGFVVEQGERIFRAVVADRADEIDRLISSEWVQRRVASGSMVASRWVPASEVAHPSARGFKWLEHTRLNFPCYPHELTAVQLHESAMLTLELAREAHQHGWRLKDCSAWNVLFSGGAPVFCDVLSLVRSEPTSVWPAYGQFHRHFVIPLLLYRHLGMSPASLFLWQRDGVTPEAARRMLRGARAWLQPALEAVTLPALLARRQKETGGAPLGAGRHIDERLANHLMERTFRRLGKHLHYLQPRPRRHSSVWAQYESERAHYSDADLESKRAIVRQTMMDERIQTVLDLGCNAGEFSFIAESCGKRVVAADNDEHSLEILSSRVREHRSRVQPLYLNVGRPTPSVGWMGEETPGVLQRMVSQFDCILVLGLIHHLLISERVPLERVCELLHSLRPRTLLLEWVEPNDPRFRALAGLNADLYSRLNRRVFENEISRWFRVAACHPLPSRRRILYRCERQ